MQNQMRWKRNKEGNIEFFDSLGFKLKSVYGFVVVAIPLMIKNSKEKKDEQG